MLPADKGNATVILNRTVNDQKKLALIPHEDTYTRLEKDPTSRQQKNFQKLLADAFRVITAPHNYLDFKLLCHIDSNSALYGFPEFDKPGGPLRPIMNFTRALLYILYGYLHRLKSPLAGRRHSHIQNSSHFIQKAKDLYGRR